MARKRKGESANEQVVEEPKVEEPQAEELQVEEPKAEELKVEEPQVEEPKVEELKAEEPKAEEPKGDGSKAEEDEGAPEHAQTDMVRVRVLADMSLLAGKAVWRNEVHEVMFREYEKALRYRPGGFELVE